MAVTAAQLQQLYLAYFGRPADFDGIVYYTTGNWDIWQVAQAFGESPESQALYGPGFNASVINAIYHNLFNRDAEADGLLYWSQQVASGALTPGEAALGILLGAQNADAVAVANKLTVAAAFTADLNTAPEILAYTGDAAAAAARAFLATVTADPATVTAAEGNLDAVVANIIDIGGITGLTVALTADPDTFTAPNQTYIDTVNGIVDAKGTFTDSDKIVGNGHTVVNVTIKDATIAQPFVTMSDIAKVAFTYAGTATTVAAYDASSWTNIHQVTLAGADGLTLDMKGLSAADSFALKIDGGTTGALAVTAATVNGMFLDGSIQNNAASSVGAVASFGSAIDITLGTKGVSSFDLSQVSAATAAGTAAAVGDITLSHVTINAGAKLALANTMYVNNAATATSASATAGSVSLGDVTLTAGESASASLTVSNYANAKVSGTATVGDITVGNVVLNSAGKSGFVWAQISQTASADVGSAIAGNLTVGSVTLEGTGYAYLTVSNQARASTTGSATAGNLSIGDVTISGAHGTSDMSVSAQNDASAWIGAATVGNMAVGNIAMTAGKADFNYASLAQYAQVYTSGTSTVGSVTVGNVNLTAAGKGSQTLSIWNSANSYGTGGASTAGSITIGTVTMTVADAYNDMYVFNQAHNNGSTSAAAEVGSVTIGNITMNQTAAPDNSTNYLYVSNSAYAANKGSATAGSVSVGNININAAGITQASANNTIYLFNYADAGTIGASTIGSISVGNIVAKTGLNGEVFISVSNAGHGGTAGSGGNVVIGNVAMQGSKNASMTLHAYNFMYGVGDIGNMAIGNVSIVGDTGAGTGSFSAYNWAQDGVVGNMTIGNVNLTAQNVGLYVHNSDNAGSSVGQLTIGNVTLKGGDDGSTNLIYNQGAGTVGALSVGNVTLTTLAGKTAVAGDILHLNVTNSSTGGAVGSMGLGNIAINLKDSDKNTLGGSQAWLHIETDSGKTSGGNIVAGNITVGASGATTAAKMTAAMGAHVSFSSEVGSVTVGNITVTGGVTEAAGTKILTDNLNALSSWLTLTAGTTMTVGNVDYSGYGAVDTIDVSTYAGAASIKGGKAGGTIIDNKGTNSIDLSANTTKGDTVLLLNAQSAVKDSGGVVTAAQASLDVITGFAAGDKIGLYDNATNAIDPIDGTQVIQNTPAQTYAEFLLHAEAQITVAHNYAYVAVIDGNTYVALNNNNKVAEIVEVMGVHTFSDTANAGYLTFLS